MFRPVKNIIPSARVCRRLFVDAVDHEENRKVLAKETARIDELNKQRWSFNFDTEEPVVGGRWEWERVEPYEAVPRAYELPQFNVNVGLKLVTKCLSMCGRTTTPTIGLALGLSGKPTAMDFSSKTKSVHCGTRSESPRPRIRTSKRPRQTHITGKYSFLFYLQNSTPQFQCWALINVLMFRFRL